MNVPKTRLWAKVIIWIFVIFVILSFLVQNGDGITSFLGDNWIWILFIIFFIWWNVTELISELKIENTLKSLTNDVTDLKQKFLENE